MNTALAIITDKDKVLVGKLKLEKIKEYGDIEYVFPSAQTNDNLQETLIQEVKMQSNLDIEIVDKIGERIHPITNNLTEYYFCKKTSEQEVNVSKDADLEKLLWVTPQEILDYMPSLFDKVKEYLQTKVR